MDEQIIFEFRVFKTADGFRVEMKGDEEQMHGFRFGRGMRHFGRHFGRQAEHGWPRWERRWQRAWQSWCDESEPEEKATSTGKSGTQTL